MSMNSQKIEKQRKCYAELGSIYNKIEQLRGNETSSGCR
jgi:hypothetical protein